MRTRNISITFLSGILLSLLVFIGANAQSDILNRASADEPAAPEVFRYSNVDVVFQFGIGQEMVRGIYITEPISGIDALLATGLEIVTEDFGEYGVAVCAINGVGCMPPDPCFCQSESWNYRKWIENEWQDPGEGASFTDVNIGDVEGWRWGIWDDPETLPPAPKMVSISNALDWLKLKQNTTNGGPNP